MSEYVKTDVALRADLQTAAERFPLSGPAYISHENNQPTLASDYLRSAGCSPVIVDRIFSPTSEWIFSAESTDLYQLTPVQLIEYMLAVTAPLYEAAQSSLSEVNWFGYNDHNVAHIRSVAVRALRLVQQAGYDDDVQRRTVIAAVGHDLGNIFDRDVHSLISPKILERVFPRLTEDALQWRLIRRAMELHDSEVYDRYMQQWSHLHAADRFVKMREVFGPEALALLAADKMDVGRHRVNRKALSPAAIDEHAYSEVNLSLVTSEAAVVAEGGRVGFDWDLQFIPHLQPYELKRFVLLAVPNEDSPSGFNVYASPRVRKSNDDASPDFAKSRDLFSRKHMGRNLTAIEAIFALFPQIELFKIRYTSEDSLLDEYAFNRQTVDADMAKFKAEF